MFYKAILQRGAEFCNFIELVNCTCKVLYSLQLEHFSLMTFFDMTGHLEQRHVRLRSPWYNFVNLSGLIQGMILPKLPLILLFSLYY